MNARRLQGLRDVTQRLERSGHPVTVIANAIALAQKSALGLQTTLLG